MKSKVCRRCSLNRATSDNDDEISSSSSVVVGTTIAAATNVPQAVATTVSTTEAIITAAAEATVPAVTIEPAATIAVEEASIVPAVDAIAAAAIIGPPVVITGGPPVSIAAAADTVPATTIEIAITADVTVVPAAAFAAAAVATKSILVTTGEPTAIAAVGNVPVVTTTITVEAAVPAVATTELETAIAVEATVPALVTPGEPTAIAAVSNAPAVNDVIAGVTIVSEATAAETAIAAASIITTETAIAAPAATVAAVTTIGGGPPAIIDEYQPKLHQEEATTTALVTEHTGGEVQSVSSSSTGESESKLLKCIVSQFQYSSSITTSIDHERAVESCIKELPQFLELDKIDINYQGENIHAMFNEEATHIVPLGNVDLSCFRDRRGNVYYVTNLDASQRSSSDLVLVVVAWRANLKDAFGTLQVLSFEEYLFYLDNRYFWIHGTQEQPPLPSQQPPPEQQLLSSTNQPSQPPPQPPLQQQSSSTEPQQSSSADDQLPQQHLPPPLQQQQQPPPEQQKQSSTSAVPIATAKVTIAPAPATATTATTATAVSATIASSAVIATTTTAVKVTRLQPPSDQLALQDLPPSPQHSTVEQQLFEHDHTQQDLIPSEQLLPQQNSNTGLILGDPVGTVSLQSGLRRRQRAEEKEEVELREEKEVDEQDEVQEELQHPAATYVSNAQLQAEKNIADNAEVVHSSPNNYSWPLKVAGTTFHLSSFHFATNNTSVPLYNNPNIPRKARLEYIDFSRPQLYLYMWDRRHAVSLSLKSPDTGRYQMRFFLAMTNLYMPLDDTGDSVFEELVLLDILNRMDPYGYLDAVVGVVATGEVKLWKYSLNHLRFNYCDLQRPLKRGETFWFAKLQQFYSDRGLLYLVQRLVPRDLDAPKNRFAVSKDYITHYKHNIKTIGKAEENFKKWLLLPGKNKSSREESEDLQALLSRASKGKCGSDQPAEKTKAQIEQEAYAAKTKAAAEKRKATLQAKKEAAVLEQAAVLDKAAAEARAAAAAAGTSTKATTKISAGTTTTRTAATASGTIENTSRDRLPTAINNLHDKLQVQQIHDSSSVQYDADDYVTVQPIKRKRADDVPLICSSSLSAAIDAETAKYVLEIKAKFAQAALARSVDLEAIQQRAHDLAVEREKESLRHKESLAQAEKVQHAAIEQTENAIARQNQAEANNLMLKNNQRRLQWLQEQERENCAEQQKRDAQDYEDQRLLKRLRAQKQEEREDARLQFEAQQLLQRQAYDRELNKISVLDNLRKGKVSEENTRHMVKALFNEHEDNKAPRKGDESDNEVLVEKNNPYKPYDPYGDSA